METIIKHKFWDKDFERALIDKHGDAMLVTDYSHYYLTKADIIAIAKAQGVTAEDLAK